MSHSDNDDLIRDDSQWLATSECRKVRNLAWEIIEATIRSQVRKIIDSQINCPPIVTIPIYSSDIRGQYGRFLRQVTERNDTAHFGSQTNPVRGDVCRFRR